MRAQEKMTEAAGGEVETEYQPPVALEEDTPLVSEPDLPWLWAVSQVVEGRGRLAEERAQFLKQMDALEDDISAMEAMRDGP